MRGGGKGEIVRKMGRERESSREEMVRCYNYTRYCDSIIYLLTIRRPMVSVPLMSSDVHSYCSMISASILVVMNTPSLLISKGTGDEVDCIALH